MKGFQKISWIILAAFALPAQAQLFQVPKALGHSVIRSTMKDLSFLRVLPNDVAQKIYAQARLQFESPAGFAKQVPRALVGVQLKPDRENIGTGFLFKDHDELFVAMAAHVGGKEGTQRAIQVFDETGQTRSYIVTVAVGGKAGWHAADVSIAPVPEEALAGGAVPLEVAPVDKTKESYSLGYTSGSFKMFDFLPLKRNFVSELGWTLVAERAWIPGEDPEEPFLFSGYCGAPVVQLQNGRWKAVGVYVGSSTAGKEKPVSRDYVINASQTFPLLLSQLRGGTLPLGREVLFRGWPIGRLSLQERVQEIQVWRDGQLLFRQELVNYPHPYTDAYSEMALENCDTKSGDTVRYLISGSNRRLREIDFILP